MAKYAVLHDLGDERTPPVGIALEMAGQVLVHAPQEFGVPERHDGEYRVLGPDMTYVTYRPGEPGYFEQVLVGLSWAFGVGEQGVVEQADYDSLLALIVHKIEHPRDRAHVGEYDVALSFARESASQCDIRVVHGFSPAYMPNPRESVPLAARGRGVAV